MTQLLGVGQTPNIVSALALIGKLPVPREQDASGTTGMPLSPRSPARRGLRRPTEQKLVFPACRWPGANYAALRSGKGDPTRHATTAPRAKTCVFDPGHNLFSLPGFVDGYRRVGIRPIIEGKADELHIRGIRGNPLP